MHTVVIIYISLLPGRLNVLALSRRNWTKEGNRSPRLAMATDWAHRPSGWPNHPWAPSLGLHRRGEWESERERRPRRVFRENTNIEPLRHFSFTRFRCSCWFFQPALRSTVICRTSRSQRNVLTVAQAEHDVLQEVSCGCVLITHKKKNNYSLNEASLLLHSLRH